MSLFNSSLEFILFVSVVLLWVLLETVDIGNFPRLRYSGGDIKRTGNSSALLLRISLYVSIIIAFMLAVNNIAMLPDWFFYPGIFLVLTGIFVRQWAMYTLGRFFTLTISVKKDQKVVDYGPYRYVRHPSYLGMLITVTGMGVALESLGGVLVILVIYGLALGYRMNVEEKFLASELGEDYVRYMKRTKRLIPFVL